MDVVVRARCLADHGPSDKQRGEESADAERKVHGLHERTDFVAMGIYQKCVADRVEYS